MQFDDRRLRVLFYAAWIAALIIQCWSVGLSGDEAYYWRYSRELAWGYFDHPPVTSLLVHVGYSVFNNELGVRLLFIILSTATIFGLEQLVKPADLKLFYAIVLSIAFLQVGMVWGGGMMAIPDFPLLFLEVAFFVLYRNYLDNPSWYITPLMAVVISLMMLTKYHGILIVGFTVLSNLRLLGRGSFWVIVGLSLVLLIPHFLWQVDNGFPSIRYHLLERSANPYSIKYTAEYLGGQPFILGPFIGLLLIFAGIVFKPSGHFEGSLKYVALGTYIFFLAMTFKGRVEANWTIITLVPLTYLGYKQIESSKRLRLLTMYSFAISICLILAARTLIITRPPLPLLGRFTRSLEPWTWCGDLKQRTGGRAVAFMNSYQKASLYEFYEGIPAFSINNFWGRKDQYNVWDTEAQFQGQDIAIVSNWEIPNLDTIRIGNEYFPYTVINNFRSTSNLLIQSDLPATITTTPQAKLTANLRFGYSNAHIRDLEVNADFPTNAVYAFFQGRTATDYGNNSVIVRNNMVGSEDSFPLEVQAPATPGRYYLYFAASTGWLPPGFNSTPIEVTVGD